MGRQLSVNEIKEGIRLAEAAGDKETVKALKEKLEKYIINEG